jgi:O-antigen/teichoic acid export membrane protein
LSFFRPEKIPLGVKVTRNVIYSGVRLFLLAPLPFLVIPFFLKKLGPAGYGTWAVFVAANGITSVADLGLVTTLSKHVAEFHALKDFRGLNRIISTGVVLYIAIASLICGILWVSAPFLISVLFRSSPVSTHELGILWYFLILLIFANTLTMLFSSVVIGLQRMDLSNGINSLYLLSSAGFSVVFLALNWGLRGVLYGYASAAWITLFVSVYATRRLLPEIKPSLSACHWSVAKEIFGFSAKTYVTQVAVVIHNQIEKIYLARFAGVVFVGWYDISSDLALKLRGIPSLILAPIMPAASELHARSDRGRIAHLYYRTHKYLALLGVPLVLYIVFASRDFVELWVGPSLSVIAIPLSILLIVNFINLTTGPGLLILVGGGKLRPGLYSAVLGIVLNVTLSLFLIRAYGFKGAVVGTSLSLTIASGFFLYLFRRETAGSFPKVFRAAYLKPIVCSLGSIALIWIFTHTDRPSWGRLVMHCLVFGVTYLILLLLLRFFDSSDLTMIEGVFPIPRIVRRIIPDDVELGGSLLPDPESVETTVS